MGSVLGFFRRFTPYTARVDFSGTKLVINSGCATMDHILITLSVARSIIGRTRDLKYRLVVDRRPMVFTPVGELSPSSIPCLLTRGNVSTIYVRAGLSLKRGFKIGVYLTSTLKIGGPILSKLNRYVFANRLRDRASVRSFTGLTGGGLSYGKLHCASVGSEIGGITMSSNTNNSGIFSTTLTNISILIAKRVGRRRVVTTGSLKVSVVSTNRFGDRSVMVLPLMGGLSGRFSRVVFAGSRSYSSVVGFVWPMDVVVGVFITWFIAV